MTLLLLYPDSQCDFPAVTEEECGDADVIARHRAWLPASFAEAAADRTHYYFDPGACTWLHRETGAFIDGRR